MLKRRDEISASVRKRFDASLHASVAAECTRQADTEGERRAAWPYRIALGRPRADELALAMREVSAYVSELRDWQAKRGFDVTWTTRHVGSVQEIPTHLIVTDIDQAARMLGTHYTHRLKVTRERARQVLDAFPHTAEDALAKVLTQTRTWEDVDFTLLLSASRWFQDNDATGLTPRQVPLAGFHAKWLNAHGRRTLICLLTGRDDLGLVETPSSLAFAYLDPDHLAQGGRRFEMYVAGDSATPAYEVEVALIVENKDTYRYFPAFPRAVCIFGSGHAGAAHVSELPWIGQVPHLVYWGDMDTDGLAILNEYRAQGLDVTSMLMDVASYERYEPFGTSRSASKRSLTERERQPLPYLTDSERALYELLLDPNHTRHRRIEQERIPLEHARHALVEAIRA